MEIWHGLLCHRDGSGVGVSLGPLLRLLTGSIISDMLDYQFFHGI